MVASVGCYLMVNTINFVKPYPEKVQQCTFCDEKTLHICVRYRKIFAFPMVIFIFAHLVMSSCDRTVRFGEWVFGCVVFWTVLAFDPGGLFISPGLLDWIKNCWVVRF